MAESAAIAVSGQTGCYINRIVKTVKTGVPRARLANGVRNWWPGWEARPENTGLKVPNLCFLAKQASISTEIRHFDHFGPESGGWDLRDLYGTKVLLQYSLCTCSNAQNTPFLEVFLTLRNTCKTQCILTSKVVILAIWKASKEASIETSYSRFHPFLGVKTPVFRALA